MSLPVRHALTETKVFQTKARSEHVMDRALQQGSTGWRRKMKRADRLSKRWIMMWLKLQRLDPRERAIPDVYPSPSHCWDNAT